VQREPRLRAAVGTTTKLDSLADRLMYRLAYRNFGDHESLVVNHSVAANTSSGGVRWYEIQNPAGTPVVAQQSTFAPDANFRWMGSIAMDHAGDMALGYSVSSATMFPSIAFTARLSGDPASTMQTESAILAGTGSQIAGLTRWGDYSAMQIDPSDDCTFWYTTEYLKGTGIFNWNTRIASFKFPGCNFPDLQIAKPHTGNFTQGQTGATFTITVANVGLKSTDGTTVTVADALPAKLTATAASGTGWTCVLSPSVSCMRSDVLASNASYPPITLTVSVAADAPGLLTNTANVSGGGDQGTPGNNQTSDTVTIIQTGPDLAITKTHPQPFIQNQPGVYTITVSNVGLSPTSGALVTVTDQVPAGLPIASVNGGGWTCSPAATNPVSCTRTDVLAAGGSYPAIALTVTPPTAPAAVSNTASVTGGGDTNPFNNSATDPTTIVVPPPDLSITKTHTGNFNQGQGSASYTLTVTNAGLGPSVGTVTVKENLPTGLGRNFIFGTGWTCDIIAMACTRGDSLAVGSSYPPITVTVSVDGNAPRDRHQHRHRERRDRHHTWQQHCHRSDHDSPRARPDAGRIAQSRSAGAGPGRHVHHRCGQPGQRGHLGIREHDRQSALRNDSDGPCCPGLELRGLEFYFLFAFRHTGAGRGLPFNRADGICGQPLFSGEQFSER